MRKTGTPLRCELPGEQRRTARRSDGIGDERIREPRAAFSESVNVRRRVYLRAVGRDGVLRMVVREDGEDVRVCRFFGVSGLDGEESEKRGDDEEVFFHRVYLEGAAGTKRC